MKPSQALIDIMIEMPDSPFSRYEDGLAARFDSLRITLEHDGGGRIVGTNLHYIWQGQTIFIDNTTVLPSDSITISDLNGFIQIEF